MRGLETVLAGANGRGVAARAATNHNQIVCHLSFRITNQLD